MRKLFLGIGIAGAVLALLAWGVMREKPLAIGYATETLESILGSIEASQRYGIPPGIVAGPCRGVDVDLYERAWTLWYKCESGGHIVLKISANRGIWFVPLMNRTVDLRVREVRYFPE